MQSRSATTVPRLSSSPVVPPCGRDLAANICEGALDYGGVYAPAFTYRTQQAVPMIEPSTGELRLKTEMSRMATIPLAKDPCGSYKYPSSNGFRGAPDILPTVGTVIINMMVLRV